MAKLTLWIAFYLWAFWGAYVLVMGIYRAHLQQRLRGVMFAMALPFVVVGFLMDVFANVVIASALFQELPREWLVTTRFQRYIRTDTGWRAKLSQYICDHLLDVFDPSGNHC